MTSGSAQAVIERYFDAATEAAMRADELLEEGDTEGSAAGQRIMAAIEQLQSERPAPGEKVQ